MRRLSGVLALLALLVAGGSAAGHAQAAKPASLSSALTVTGKEIELTDTEINRIEFAVNNSFATAQAKDWKCVTKPGDSTGTGDVQVQALVERRGFLDRHHGEDYKITVTLKIKDQPDLRTEFLWEPKADRDEDLRAFAAELADQIANTGLNNLMDDVNPCKPGAKVKAKLTQGGGGAISIGTYTADAQLSLGEDGSFDTTLPLTASIDLRIPGCTADYRYVNPQVRLAGGYRDDGNLAFTSTRMTWDGISGTLSCEGGLTCSYNTRGASVCMANGVSVATAALEDWSGIDPAAEGAVALALADGSRHTLPRPSALTADATWEASIELTYGSGGATAVAVIPISFN
jgi:hypothetical protein